MTKSLPSSDDRSIPLKQSFVRSHSLPFPHLSLFCISSYLCGSYMKYILVRRDKFEDIPSNLRPTIFSTRSLVNNDLRMSKSCKVQLLEIVS